MRQAIRALGWAAKILWIILIVFIITIAYSATQLNINLGEPQTTATEQTVTISFPVNMRNDGLYDITYFNITTIISDQNNHSLARGTTILGIPRGVYETRIHNITANITRILIRNTNLLFNDTTFTLFQYVSINYAHAIPLTVSAHQTMPWGAPLSNLAVGEITFQPYNQTHSLAIIPLSFENHNQYVPVAGNARIEIYDNSHTHIGEGTTNIDAQPNTYFNGQINVLVKNPSLSPAHTPPTGEIHLFFETSTFNYGPLVIPYG